MKRLSGVFPDPLVDPVFWYALAMVRPTYHFHFISHTPPDRPPQLDSHALSLQSRSPAPRPSVPMTPFTLIACDRRRLGSISSAGPPSPRKNDLFNTMPRPWLLGQRHEPRSRPWPWASDAPDAPPRHLACCISAFLFTSLLFPSCCHLPHHVPGLEIRHARYPNVQPLQIRLHKVASKIGQHVKASSLPHALELV